MSPFRGVSALLALLSICWFATVSQAQVTSVSDPTSSPMSGVGHDYIKLLNETVNPATGSLSLRISVPSPSGRKLTIPFAFTYDSSGAWFLESIAAGTQPPGMSSKSNSNIGPLTWGGWSTTFPQLTRVLFQKVPNYPVTDGHPTCDALTGYIFTDPSGSRHSLGLSHWYNSFWRACEPSPFQEYALGGDDYYRAALVGASNGSNYDGTPEIVDPDGTVYNFGSLAPCLYGSAGSPGDLPPLVSGLPVSIEDRNGNIVNTTNGCNGFTATDTAGRTALSVSLYGYSVTSNTTSTVSVAGLSQPYTATWSKVSPTGLSISHSQIWSFSHCSAPPAVAEAWTPVLGTNGMGTYAVTAIKLPNGQQYTLGYDPVTGFVNKITYPSGGYVSYTWGISPDSSAIQYNDQFGNQAQCAYFYDTPAITQRSVSFDGSTVALTQTFSYSTNWGTVPQFGAPYLWVGKQATVTTTDNIRGTTSKIIYNYIPNTVGVGPAPNLSSNTSYLINAVAVENTISYYGYSPSYPLLRTETKNWFDPSELSCDLITLNDGSGQISGAFYSYSPFGGQVIGKAEYDYGQLTSTSSCLVGGGTLPTPARKTVTAYQSFAATPIYPSGASILDRPSSVIVYDANGNRVAETDYAYDQATVANVSGLPTGTHDETNYASSSTVPRGNATTVTRKCLQTCTDSVTTYSYDETGQALTMTDACGNATCSDMSGSNHTTTYSYVDNYASGTGTAPGQTNAYLTTVTFPNTGVAHVEHFAWGYNDGQIRSHTDQNNQATTYTFNSPPASCTYPDSLDRLSVITFPDGGSTTYCYNDAPLNPTVTTSRLMSGSSYVTSTATADGLGHVIKTLLTPDPDCLSGDRVDATYDGVGHTYKVYNLYCNASGSSDPIYGITTYVFDALGRTTQVTNPDNTTILTTYTGRATQVQDEGNGNGTQRVTRISQSDALGRLNSVCEVSSATLTGQNGSPAACGQDIGGTGFLTAYQYDILGNLLGVTQGTMAPRTFAYNSLSQLTSATNPESGTLTYAYDANGNVSTKTGPKQNQTGTATVTTSFTYDVLNRDLSKSYNDAMTPTALYAYDTTTWSTQPTNLVGRLVESSISGSNMMTYNSYDPMGRVKVQWQYTPLGGGNLYPVPYTYDLMGNMLTSSTGYFDVTTMAYNSAGRLITVSNNVSTPTVLHSGVHYNAAGEVTSETLGAGDVQTYTYDTRTRLTGKSSTYTANGVTTPIYSFGLTLAPDGDVLSANDSANGNWNYLYDAFNRLTCSNLVSNGSCSSPTSGAATYSYVYDRFGNRWQQNTSTGGPYHFSANFTGNGTNNNNRMDGFSYDAAGNLQNDGFHQYFYDAENHLIQVDGTLGTCTTATACYNYDAEGHRVHRSGYTNDACDATGKRDYVFDLSGNWTAEVNSNGTGCLGELYAGGRRIAKTGGATRFPHTDWQGTMRVENAYGYPASLLSTCTSLPFGDGQSCNSTLDVLRFTGKERDPESGLDNFDARYDSSSLGRFMSADPIGGQKIDPQTLNKYSYVRNNPINFTDPTGLYTCRDDNNKCQTKKDIAFEKSRKENLKSKDADVVRAANSYGEKTKDNHVSVGFDDLDKKGEGGVTTSRLGADDKGNLFAQSDVTINSKLSGSALDAAVGHEGSHVADAQDVASSISNTNTAPYFTVGTDITRYQSEQRAYAVTDSILKSGNENWHFACGLSDCVLGTGQQMLTQRAGVIDQIMANSPLYRSNGQPLSSTNQGGSVVVVPH